MIARLQPRSWLVLASLAVATGCGPGGHAPVLQPLSDQVAAVSQEIVLILSAADRDGDDLSYSFETDVPEIFGRAVLSELPTGAGEFRWTPVASDVGVWFFDFTVSDGAHSDTVTIRIEVRSATGSNSAPRFVRPQGTGTVLDLALRDCITDLPIEVADDDSPEVVISEEAPLIEGSVLEITGGQTASWSWCPTARQIDADDRYTLALAADDGDNPRTLHPYLIVLRKPAKPDCPGDAPVIAHTPADANTLLGLTIEAEISDDQGLKQEPLFYYSTTAPASPPDLGQMTQVTMELVAGTMQDGTWAAGIPNPVASQPAGSTADIYYVIVADDDDDSQGDCDHVTQMPASGSYQMTVTNPGGSGGAGLCEPCTADVQCGDADDLCVHIGAGSEYFCTSLCSGPSDCPTNYTCSAQPVQSISGASARQCIPQSDDCSNPGGTTCADDGHEDDDNQAQAQTNPLLTQGAHSLVSCPASSGSGDDEDWFEIFVGVDTQITLNLSGGSQSDLDLALYAENGSIIESSTSLTSTENITLCLGSGFYLVRVYAYGATENPYTLTYSAVAMSCNLPSCVPDDNEDDDDAASARDAQPPYSSIDQTICAGDDDWFTVELNNNETVVVDLTFVDDDVDTDLDVHLYDSPTHDLYPCSPANPMTCDTSNGQTGTSNEHFEHTAPSSGCAPCVYYVVVRGYDDSENTYDISIATQ